MWYRVWQLWQALIARPLTIDELGEIEQVLTEAEFELFRRFSVSNQFHSYRVMQDLL